jgi:hypothetical protein
MPVVAAGPVSAAVLGGRRRLHPSRRETEGAAVSVTLVPAGRTDMLYTTSGTPRRRETWLRYRTSGHRTEGTA